MDQIYVKNASNSSPGGTNIEVQRAPGEIWRRLGGELSIKNASVDPPPQTPENFIDLMFCSWCRGAVVPWYRTDASKFQDASKTSTDAPGPQDSSRMPTNAKDGSQDGPRTSAHRLKTQTQDGPRAQ